MLNRAQYPQFKAVLLEVERFLAQWQRDPLHTRLIERALGKLRRDFLADRIFPALTVPTMAAQALGQDESPALTVLNAAHFLFYAFLDLTDDVEDHELEDPLWRQLGEPIAINAGTSLLFAALLMLDRLAAQGVAPSQVALLRGMFSEAGWLLTIGQHRDLASSRTPELSPEYVLETHRLKTGTSVRLYLESAAVLAGATQPQRAHFAALGEALGVMVQILGDWFNLQEPLSSDLQNHCQSLPLALLKPALSGSDCDIYRAAWIAAPKDPTAHDVMRHLLSKHDTASRIDQHLARYRRHTELALSALRASGCQVGHLEDFVARFKPLSP